MRDRKLTRGRVFVALSVVAILIALPGGLLKESRSDGTQSPRAQSTQARATAGHQAVVELAEPTVTVPIGKAAAEIERLTGSEAPPGSCLATPHQARCPEVREVVITLPSESEPGPTGFVPLIETTSGEAGSAVLASVTSGSADGAQLIFHYGAACAIEATTPVVGASAQANHRHHCFTGQYVSSMETWGDLQRWNATDARWYVLDNCYRRPSGPTTQQCSTFYACYHPNATRKYRGVTSGYAVQRGVGWFGTDYSSTKTAYCT